jgi:hypothetical protein
MGKARKRVLKQARKIPENEIVQFLTHDGTCLSDYYLENRHGYTAICLWHPQNGSMEMLVEDGAMGLAAIEYLERQGVPRIASRDELEQLARRNNGANFTYRGQGTEGSG